MSNCREFAILGMLSACGGRGYGKNATLDIQYYGKDESDQEMAASMRRCTEFHQLDFAPRNCTVNVLYNDSRLPEVCRDNAKNGMFILYPVCAQEAMPALAVEGDRKDMDRFHLSSALSCYYAILAVTTMDSSEEICVPYKIHYTLAECREQLKSRKYIVHADVTMSVPRVLEGQ